MLRLGTLAPGQQAYYLDTVAGGAEEYYTGAKEAPGEWLGNSAAFQFVLTPCEQMYAAATLLSTVETPVR
jgi:hypothetical protein